VRGKRFAKIGIAVVVVLVLLGCGTGVVCDHGVSADRSKYEISYKDTVDDGGKKEVKTVRVNEGEMVACQNGEEWPACKKDAPEVPGVPKNLPRRDPKWTERDRNAKTLCVSLVSYPQAKVTNSWFIGRGGVQTQTGIWGVFTECGFAQPGQVAWIQSEHHAQPSTFMCSVFLWEGGKKQILDWAFGQQFSDCSARGRVP
jgi:hypothetical protein